jgi:nitroreductase
MKEHLMIRDLVLKNRSYRRFFQDVAISRETLIELVDLARLSPSGRNVQPYKYFLSNEAEMNAKIFPTLSWAGYLKSWGGPVEGERPSAYIILLGDREISPSFGVDQGIATQSILLGAAEKELGGCIIATVQRPTLQAELKIAENFEILLVLALGKPKEIVVLDPVGPTGDIKYWRDENQVHHVPKRALDELIVG